MFEIKCNEICNLHLHNDFWSIVGIIHVKQLITPFEFSMVI